MSKLAEACAVAVCLTVCGVGCDDGGAASSTGCGKDTDCRGARVCVEGACAADPAGSTGGGVGRGSTGGRAPVGGLGGSEPPPVGGQGGAVVEDGAVEPPPEGGLAIDAGLGPQGGAEAGGEPGRDAGPSPDAGPAPDAASPDAGLILCTDLDGDGFGEGPECLDTDCADDDPAVNPDAREIPYDGVDNDCDGADLTDVDGDGFDAVVVGGDDCDDEDRELNPDAVEVPGDGVDQNCDGSDQSPEADADGDGFESRGVGGDDCDDRDPNVNPAAEEIPYDGIDNDCADGDLVDFDGDGEAAVGFGGEDCDDLDPAIGPHLREVLYNDQDDDCDPSTPDSDVDGDGFVALVGGGRDCDDEDPTVNPDAEEILYNGVDDDCDQQTRDDDLDFDGWDQAEDCDDQDADRNPDVAEVVGDGVDNDCDGEIDEAPGRVCPGHDEMVGLRAGGCIDRYEASRADATADSPGVAEVAARSRLGVLPWAGITLQGARDACLAAGKHLCGHLAWSAGCAPVGQRYPYGFDYDGAACNTADANRGAAAPTGSFAACVSPSGAVDMSGNLGEWVDEENAQLGSAQLDGGSYLDPGDDAACGVALFESVDASSPALGFRCCIDPAG